ncbi:hypothetical protein AVEN_94714-1 [Araneus ventricosus]|uniref:Uncharacterized protein n=1 Tax=Araneus ventricosus TaxID=182803 RepID=A0A4Y2CNB1_ARAVE|nr:hypothetical protein AVEN_94714-1 [Araneus ventricosus]
MPSDSGCNSAVRGFIIPKSLQSSVKDLPIALCRYRKRSQNIQSHSFERCTHVIALQATFSSCFGSFSGFTSVAFPALFFDVAAKSIPIKSPLEFAQRFHNSKMAST